MNPGTSTITYFDALYGTATFNEMLSALIRTPVVQRLRHVRLSNIDSLAMPGISNISRYEHVLGTGLLAQSTGVYGRIPEFDRIALSAAALLHDWAITSYGHLVEEAFKYLNTGFDHERHLLDILSGDSAGVDTGGIDRQILCGRQTNLSHWARQAVAGRATELLHNITDFVRGEGRWGPLVSGSIDLDNIDNVYRIAYHMGLEVDRLRPRKLAEAIIGVDIAQREPILATGTELEIEGWLTKRREVYERLMPAQPDFACKVMVLYAAVKALRAGELGQSDWNLTDAEFAHRLSTSSMRVIQDVFARWTTGEVWDMTPLHWCEGDRPEFPRLLSFSDELSRLLGRDCFAYGIKDKRGRRLMIRFEDGSRQTFGAEERQWLLGVGSPKRQAFSKSEVETVLTLAARFFGTRIIGSVEAKMVGHQAGAEQLCLL